MPLLGHAAPLRAEAEARPHRIFNKRTVKSHGFSWDIYSNDLLNPMKTEDNHLFGNDLLTNVMQNLVNITCLPFFGCLSIYLPPGDQA